MRTAPLLTFILILQIFFFHHHTTKACTAFMMKSGNKVLAGNNEDGSNPETRIWTIRAGEKGTYGRIYFGYNDLSAQGGINEKGLWYDAFGLPFQPAGPVKGDIFPGDLQDLLMAECATVKDVMVMLKKYNRSQMTSYQWMFGDKSGNAVIIEADTMFYITGNYQVITNFRNSRYPSGKGFECARYQTANKILGDCREADVNTFRKILSDVHSEGQDATLYSYIADLTNGLIYVYHFHNFENVVVLDIRRELEKGSKVYRLADLFPPTVAAETFAYWAAKALNDTKKSRFFPGFDFESLPGYCGNYIVREPQVMAGQKITVTRNDTCLYLQLNGGGNYDLIPDASQSFSMLGYGGLDFKCTFPQAINSAKELHLDGGPLHLVAVKTDDAVKFGRK